MPFLARIYAFKLFDSLILILPLYAVMFVDAGLTPTEVGVALAAWSIATFALQAPAGVLADLWPRRLILAGAQVMRGACFALWIVWPTFWGFLIGLVLWGFKSAFTNGVFEALLYDELKAQGRAADYTRIYGRTRAVSAGAILLAAGGASLVARAGYDAALAASLVSVVVCAAVALSLPPAPPAVASGARDYLGQIRRGFGFAASQPVVLSILVFAAFVNALGPALQEYWPIYGREVGLPRSAIALYIGVQYATEALAAVFAHRLAGWPARLNYGLFALAGLLLLGAGALFIPAAMLLLAFYSGLMRVNDVVFEGKLQAEIPSDARATISAVKGVTGQVGVFSLYLGFGPLAGATSYQTAFLVFGGLVVAIGVAYLGAGLTRRPATTRT